MNIQPGTDIGRYHILEQLGEGGMAVVYKAYDTRLETEVAVKFIRTGSLPADSIPRIQKRFQIEAKRMAQLNHPNIVKVMDYGDFNGLPYLVMPFLPGGTLKKMLGTPLAWQDAIRILIPIANALGFAHKEGLIHRDVKPSNILITQSGEPMLSDFGIAKVLDNTETIDLTTSTMGIGTPEYMAPEQASNKGFDHRVDIYALGIVFFEMITGRVPYSADTPLAVIIKQATEPLPQLGKYISNVPKEIERILYKALAKNPAERFPDMSSFVNSVEKLKYVNPAVRNNDKVHPIEEKNEQKKSNHQSIAFVIALVAILIFVAILLAKTDLIPLPQSNDTQNFVTSSPMDKPLSTQVTKNSPTKTSVLGIDSKFIQEDNFFMIDTSGFANYPNDGFVSPPFGRHNLNNIPYLISSGDDAIFQTQHITLTQLPNHLTLDMKIQDPIRVYVLLVGSAAYKDLGVNYSGIKIGEVELIFSSSEEIHSPIIVCENIREGWSYDNDSFNKNSCSPTKSKYWQNSWSEEQMRGDQLATAVIDTLIIEIPQGEDFTELTGIRIFDQKYETSIIIFGITIETSTIN